MAPQKGGGGKGRLLEFLRSTNSADEVHEFIEDSDLGWRKLGGKENVGIVRSGSSPAQALTERFTNGIDAVIERAVQEEVFEETPSNPREAVTDLFGLSEAGYNAMSKTWVRDVAKNNLRVVIQESGRQTHPVIEVHDTGIGQRPSAFEDTFLSLNQDNKVTKPYLIGKYGQGGSNTFEFCEYAIIISRHAAGGDIGWSIVRYNDRTDVEDETYTDGIFEYCVNPDGSVPSITEEIADGWTGSTVRLIEYDATDFNDALSPSSGSLYTVVHETMFGSIFPLYLEDHRVERFSGYEGSPRRRTVVGSRYRLDQPAKDVDRAREFKTIDLGEFGSLRVKYWILESTDAAKQFVDKSRPIIFTHHGQKHHAESKRFFKRTGYSFLKDRIIIEVCGDELTPRGKRIFSSTRDRLSKSDAYRAVTESLLASLRDDNLLEDLNEEYRVKALTETSSKQAERAKSILADLLQQADASPTGTALTDGGRQGKNGSGGGAHGRRDPVKPRHEFPTSMEIDNVSDPLEAMQGRTMRVRVRLDAEDEFESIRGGEVTVDWDENLEDVLSYRNETALTGGWKIFQLEVDDDAVIGTIGTLKVQCTWPSGSLETFRDVEVVEPVSSTGGQRSATLQAPEIHEVNAEDDERRSALGWERDDSVVQYEPEEDGPGDVFVAIFNEHIQPIRETNDTEGLIEQRDTQYAAYISYFELMRHQEIEEEKVEPDEEYVNREKNRAAKMLMRSISEGMSPEALGLV